MVMSKKTTGLPLAIASKTMGSAIVTDMAATCGAAAKQLFTMRFRRRRLRRYDAAMACGDLCHVAQRFAAMVGSGHSLAATSIHATQLLVLAHSCSETRENESYRAQDRRAGS